MKENNNNNLEAEKEEIIEPAETDEKSLAGEQLQDLGAPVEITAQSPSTEQTSTDISTTETQNDNNKKKSNKGLKVLIITLISVLVLAGAGVGCYFAFFKGKASSNSDEKKSETKSIKNKSAEVFSTYKLTGNGLEDFDLSFLKINNSNKNTIYSPLSIKYALQMLSEGANGNTKKEIDSTIGSYKTKKYNNSQNMSFANGMFIKNSFKNNINPQYTNQ